MNPSRDISRLLEIMTALRTPGTGCPWDLEQTFSSITAYTIEEAYEVADAVQRGDLADLRDELGDLLLQVVFHAQMAREQGLFDFGDVVDAITTKLVRRHPHVFGTAQDLSPGEVKSLWDEIKLTEKAERRLNRERLGVPEPEEGFLGGIPTALPALTRAQKLTAKAAKVGFDWPDADQVVAKIHEELDEVREAAAGSDRDRIEDEIGDLLFAAANLSRHYGIDPETALRRTNAKFERRFGSIEKTLATRGESSGRRKSRNHGGALGRGQEFRAVLAICARARLALTKSLDRLGSREAVQKPRLLAGHHTHPQNRVAVFGGLAVEDFSVLMKPREALAVSRLDGHLVADAALGEMILDGGQQIRNALAGQR